MSLEDIRVEAAHDYAKKKEFESWINHLTHLFNTHLGKIVLGIVFRILLVLTENEDNVFRKEKLDVVENEFIFPYAKFWKAGTDARKAMVVEFIREKLDVVAKLQKWGAKPFRDVYDRVIATGLENTGVSEKAVPSPDKKWKARWQYDFQPDKIVYSALVEPFAGGKANKLTFLEGKPFPAYLKGNLSKLVWKDNNTLTLVSKDGARVSPVKIAG